MFGIDVPPILPLTMWGKNREQSRRPRTRPAQPSLQKAQQKSRLRKSRMSAIKTREASGSPSFLDDGVVQHRGLPLFLNCTAHVTLPRVTSLRSPDHARKARRCEEKTEVGTRAPKQPKSISRLAVIVQLIEAACTISISPHRPAMGKLASRAESRSQCRSQIARRTICVR